MHEEKGILGDGTIGGLISLALGRKGNKEEYFSLIDNAIETTSWGIWQGIKEGFPERPDAFLEEAMASAGNIDSGRVCSSVCSELSALTGLYGRKDISKKFLEKALEKAEGEKDWFDGVMTTSLGAALMINGQVEEAKKKLDSIENPDYGVLDMLLVWGLSTDRNFVIRELNTTKPLTGLNKIRHYANCADALRYLGDNVKAQEAIERGLDVRRDLSLNPEIAEADFLLSGLLALYWDKRALLMLKNGEGAKPTVLVYSFIESRHAQALVRNGFITRAEKQAAGIGSPDVKARAFGYLARAFYER